MKKKYIALAVLSLLIGYFSKIYFWSEDERDIYFPITKEQLKIKRSAASMPATKAKAE